MGFTSFTRQEYRESRRVDYLGELTLEDGKVYRRLHEAGWTDGEGREVAALQDWRGSLRATWTDTGEGGEKVFDDLTGYYPYGLPWADWQGSERWLYGGKELEREHGLWTYDFHAREQDPALGRFRAPDPLADRYKHLNPYLYAAANPITYTDPTGCILQPINEESRDYMENDLRQVYKEEYADIRFDESTMELSVNLRKDDIADKEILNHMKHIDKLVQKLINKDEIMYVSYVDESFEWNGKKLCEEGAITDVDNKIIYILQNLDQEFTVMPDNNNPELNSLAPITFRETSASALLHEFKEMDLGHKMQRGAVIDYGNHGRAVLGMPKRYYDVHHSKVTKVQYE